MARPRTIPRLPTRASHRPVLPLVAPVHHDRIPTRPVSFHSSIVSFPLDYRSA